MEVFTGRVTDICTDRGRDRDATEIPNHSTKKRTQQRYQKNGLLFPTKFLYYDVFDRWNFDLFGTDFKSIKDKQNLCAIKRTKKNASQWNNMYGLELIKHNIKSICTGISQLSELILCENIGDDDNKQNANRRWSEW